MDPLTAALDRLFGAPFEQFVSLRKEIAQELKKAGDAATAKAVAAFAKPSRTAWALNQAARKRPELVKAALEAWATAAGAPRSGDADLRATARAYRERSAEVVQAADDAAKEDGSPLNLVQTRRIAATLQAIAGGDDDARERLLAGRLAADVDVDDPFAGLEVASGEARERKPAGPATHAGGATARGPAPPPRDDLSARRAAARAREQEKEREKRAREVEKARERVGALETEAREARSAAREAEVAATRAQAEADRARRAVEAVERKLEEARGELRSLGATR